MDDYQKEMKRLRQARWRAKKKIRVDGPSTSDYKLFAAEVSRVASRLIELLEKLEPKPSKLVASDPIADLRSAGWDIDPATNQPRRIPNG
jgi:hypothetical protein